MAKEVNIYKFISPSKSLLTNIAYELRNDPNWNAIYSSEVNNRYSRNGWNLRLISKTTPNELYFTLCMQMNSYSPCILWGMKDNSNEYSTPYPELTAIKGRQYSTPLVTSSISANPTYKCTVVTNEDYVYIQGDYTSTDNVLPIHIYLGRCTPHTVEDPTIAKDFVGIFPMVPLPIGDSVYNFAGGSRRTGRGIVRKSLNGTEYVPYHFTCMSNMTSPGSGDLFHVSPFYVFADNEGVRGEFSGIRTAVLRKPSEYPDGSILDLGTERYRILYVNDNINVTTTAYIAYDGYDYSYNGAVNRFFNSVTQSSGKRIMLFKI